MADGSEPVAEVVRYADGTVKMDGARLDGELHGPWRWYRTDGTVMRTGQFDRGRQVGAWRTFARSGRLVKETDFGSAPSRAETSGSE
jgi:antitoxin component YwqK of YwqJK toxin-antitoxin module